MDLRPPRHRPGLRGLLLRQSNIHVRVSHAGATRRDAGDGPGARSGPSPRSSPTNDTSPTARHGRPFGGFSPTPARPPLAPRRHRPIPTRTPRRAATRPLVRRRLPRLRPAGDLAPRALLRASRLSNSARRNVGLRTRSSTLLDTRPRVRSRPPARRVARARNIASHHRADAPVYRGTVAAVVGGVAPEDGPSLSCEHGFARTRWSPSPGCTPPPAKYFGITPYVYRRARRIRSNPVRVVIRHARGGRRRRRPPSRSSLRRSSAGAAFDAFPDGNPHGRPSRGAAAGTLRSRPRSGADRVLSDAIDALRTHAENARRSVRSSRTRSTHVGLSANERRLARSVAGPTGAV